MSTIKEAAFGLSSRRAGLRMWCVGLAVAMTACAGANEDAAATATLGPRDTSASISSSTTTTQPKSVAQSLVDILSHPRFTAEASITAVVRAQGFDYTSTGTGVVSGADSMHRQDSDFSQLTYTVMDNDGNVLGPGGLSSLVEESRLVDGNLYQRNGDGRWMRLDTTSSDTAFGHVFATLKSIREVDDLGLVIRDGASLHHFRPVPPVEYDPTYFDINPDELTTFVAITDLYTNDRGEPQVIEIEFGLKHVASGAQVWTETYQLDEVGSTIEVERPLAWVSARALGFPFRGVDLLVPDDWRLADSSDSFMVFVTPDDYVFSVAGGPAEEADAGQLMKEFAAAQQSDILETRDLASTMFQGVIADVRGPNDEVAAFYATTHRGMGIVATWISPNRDRKTDVFEEVMSTLVLKPLPEEMLVPGETIGDRTLQNDVLNTILVAEPECQETSVVYTRFVSISSDGWSEDWYLVACGALRVTRVDFTYEEDGILFGFKVPFESVGVGPDEQ